MKVENEVLEQMIDFLNGIDIKVVETELSDDTFLPGLDLKGSSILMDRKKLKYPGDLLHEAGHIAVADPKLRPLIGTDEIPENWPEMGDEIVTILWSYAAVRHLDIDPSIVFHPHGYRDSSDWFKEQFGSGTYMGLPLLEWMGLCDSEEFPMMKKWVR